MTFHNYKNSSRNIMVLIASIKNTLITDDTFISFFKLITDEQDKICGNLIAIENLSHNNIICAFCKNKYCLASSTSSYYFYNYIANTIKSEKSLVII